MVMLKPKGKPFKIAEKIMKQKGVKVRKPESMQKTNVSGPYLQH